MCIRDRVLFDHPMKGAEERRSYHTFLAALKGLGYNQLQQSVYVRYVDSFEKTNTLLNNTKTLAADSEADVVVIRLSDMQYERVLRFSTRAGRRSSQSKESQQIAFL